MNRADGPLGRLRSRTDGSGLGSFLIPGLASLIIGAVLGGLLVYGVTVAIQQNSRPAIDRSGDAGSSLLNNVEYGSR